MIVLSWLIVLVVDSVFIKKRRNDKAGLSHVSFVPILRKLRVLKYLVIGRIIVMRLERF